MPNMDKLFSDFDDADPSKTSGQNDKINVQGRHVVEITSVRYKESDQYNAIYFLVDFKIVETTSDMVKVGAEYTWSHDMTNKFFGAANTKQFIAAAVGLDAKSDEAKALDRSSVEEAWGEDQPLAGSVVGLLTQPKETKGGYAFVVHTWAVHA